MDRGAQLIGGSEQLHGGTTQTELPSVGVQGLCPSVGGGDCTPAGGSTSQQAAGRKVLPMRPALAPATSCLFRLSYLNKGRGQAS